MPRSLLALVLVVLAPLPALSDPCADEIRGLFSDGPLDPFSRPNRVETTVTRHPDGTETPLNTVWWDGTLKSINHQNGTYFMAVGTKAWQGASIEGPWTFQGSMGDYDPDELTRGVRDTLARNLTEADCPGMVELDGRSVVKYAYRTRTDPNMFGSWWGGYYTIYIDPESGTLVREERAEGVASWAPEPARTVEVRTVVYDDAIRIVEPE